MVCDEQAGTTDHTYTYGSVFEEDSFDSWNPSVGLDSYVTPDVTAALPDMAISGPENQPVGYVKPFIGVARKGWCM